MTNYLENISLLKQLEPIMKRLGVKEDSYLFVDLFKTYRSDTLENVLPDWCWDCEIEDFCFTFSFPIGVDKPVRGVIQELREEILFKRGQPKLEALAELILLLHKNGIELKRGEG